jgi:hypothetical protein
VDPHEETASSDDAPQPGEPEDDEVITRGYD